MDSHISLFVGTHIYLTMFQNPHNKIIQVGQQQEFAQVETHTSPTHRVSLPLAPCTTMRQHKMPSTSEHRLCLCVQHQVNAFPYTPAVIMQHIESHTHKSIKKDLRKFSARTTFRIFTTRVHTNTSIQSTHTHTQHNKIFSKDCAQSTQPDGTA
jgi:hypothetical protein